jgi:hypothetical protein
MATEKNVRAMRPGALHAVPRGLWVIDDEMPVLAFLDDSALQVTVIDDWFDGPASREWAPRRPACTTLTGDDSRCWVAAPDASGVFCFSASGKTLFKVPGPVRGLAATGESCWALLDLAQSPDSRKAHPLWRLDRTGTTSFDTDFPLHALVTMRREIFALSRKKGDRRGDGDPSFVVLQLDDTAHAEVLVEIKTPQGAQLKLHAGKNCLWAEVDTYGFKWPGAHWIQALEPSRQGWHWGPEIQLPQTIHFAVDGEDVAWAWMRVRDVHNSGHSYEVLRKPLRQEAEQEARCVLPGDIVSGLASGSRAWCVSRPGMPLPPERQDRSLLRLSAPSAGDIEVTEFTQWPDIAARIPEPSLPDGVNPDEWAEFQCASIRASLTHVSRGVTGTEIRPYIKGANIESVSLAGRFPATECLIRFTLEAIPGIPFARRLRLFDDLGAPKRVDYEALWLKEKIESGGIPAPRHLILDVDGVAWV